MTTKFSFGRQKRDATVTKTSVAGASVSGAHVVGGRLLGPSAMGPLAIAVSAVGAVAIGRLAIANAVIRKLRAQEIEIGSLKVGTLEVGGRRWPESAGASEGAATPESPESTDILMPGSPTSAEFSATPGALGTPVGPATPDMPGASMGIAGDVAARDDPDAAGTGA